jgi:uncharacterized SAM-binding protein YcdF (DUF218 family)
MKKVIAKLLPLLKKIKMPPPISLLIPTGMVIIIYVIFVSFLWGRFDTFNFLVGILGVLIILIAIMKEKLLKIALKFPKWIKISGKVFLCVIAASFLMVEGIIVSHMRGKAAVNETEYLVILGCQVNGSLASVPLLRRGYNAVNYLKRHEDVKAVITGGQGPGENITEAEAMRRLLTENGIGKERILIEDKSRSTIENLRFSHELYNLLDKNIVIVTSDYHMFRSLSIAKKLGYKNVAGIAARSQLSVLPAYLLREYAAVMYYVLLGRM